MNGKIVCYLLPSIENHFHFYLEIIYLQTEGGQFCKCIGNYFEVHTIAQIQNINYIFFFFFVYLLEYFGRQNEKRRFGKTNDGQQEDDVMPFQ